MKYIINNKLKKFVALILVLSMCISVPPIKASATSMPMLGEIKLFAGNFAPRGWAFCDGQYLSTSEYQALFSILGTTYGGDGRVLFALPNLNGRATMGTGRGPGLTTRALGDSVGEEFVTLSTSQMPSHNHVYSSSATAIDTSLHARVTEAYGSSSIISGAGIKSFAKDSNLSRIYSDGEASVSMLSSLFNIADTLQAQFSTNNTGGGANHENRSPYLTLNYIIAIQGSFESRIESYYGEVIMYAGVRTNDIRYFTECDGKLIAVSQNDALFSLLGTIYGGDGRTTFGVPDLRGRVPIHHGTGPGLPDYRMGQRGGAETETLVGGQIPEHSHFISEKPKSFITQNMPMYSGIGNSAVPEGNVFAAGARNEMIYSTNEDAVYTTSSTLNVTVSGVSFSVENEGDAQSHNNMMPTATIKYLICTYGTYPSRNSGGLDETMGMINIYAFNFEPGGTAKCDGQILPISQHSALFSIIGTTYGGDGRTTVGLPDLRGRVVVGEGSNGVSQNYQLGSKGGQVNVTLATQNMPSHSHNVTMNFDVIAKGTMEGTLEQGNNTSGLDNIFARGLKNERIYSDQGPNTFMTDALLGVIDFELDASATEIAGENLAHNNMQPYLTLNYCINTVGVFPSRN